MHGRTRPSGLKTSRARRRLRIADDPINDRGGQRGQRPGPSRFEARVWICLTCATLAPRLTAGKVVVIGAPDAALGKIDFRYLGISSTRGTVVVDESELPLSSRINERRSGNGVTRCVDEFERGRPR
jgi:hypothetical protein